MPPKHQSSVNQPHDKLVRRLLTNLTTVHDLLEVFLPEPIKNLINLNTLERQPDTFVDAQHRISEVDVLFKAKTKNTQNLSVTLFGLLIPGFTLQSVFMDDMALNAAQYSESLNLLFQTKP